MKAEIKDAVSDQKMQQVCAGLFALTALFNLIYTIVRINDIRAYYSENTDSPGFVVILFVICLFIIAVGSGLISVFFFSNRDAKVGYIIVVIGLALCFLQQLISLIQYIQVAFGYYYDGFWSYNLFTLLSDAILTCVFIFFIVLPSLGNIDVKSISVIIMIALAVSFVAVLLSGVGEDISLHPLQIVRTLLISAAAIVLTLIYVNTNEILLENSDNTPIAITNSPGETTTLEAEAATSEIKQDDIVVKNADPTIENITQIKQYKKLLDEGIISEEDFNRVKRQMLGL